MGAHFLCIFDPCHNFFIFMACWLKIALQNGMFVTGRYLSAFIFVINCAISGWITGGHWWSSGQNRPIPDFYLDNCELVLLIQIN
jgi:hypothetical protein